MTPYRQSINDSLYFEDGYVGIGTTFPRSTLHVHGALELSSNTPVRIFTNDNGQIYVNDMTNNVMHVLNPLTTKGDLIVHNGSQEVRLPVGPTNAVLISDETTATGLSWYPMSNIEGIGSSVLTTKGDLVVHDGNADVRLPVGSDGTVLIADYTAPSGIAWVPLSNVPGYCNAVVSTSSFTQIQGGVGVDILYARRIYTDALYTSYPSGASNILSDVLTVTYVQNIESLNASIENVDTQTLTASTMYASNIIYREEPTIFSIPATQVENTVYTKVYSWIYQGASQKVRDPSRILARSYLYSSCNAQTYLTSPNFTYNLRVMDVTNNLLLGQVTASNSAPAVKSIPITLLSRSNIDIEIQCKKGVAGDFVVLDSLTAEYGELSGNIQTGAYVGEDFFVNGDMIVTGDLLPSSNLVYDIGSSAARWRDLYLSGDGIDLGGVRISKVGGEPGTGIQVLSEQNEPLDIQTRNVYTSANIGIGTTIATRRLHVQGDINFTGSLFQNGVEFVAGEGNNPWALSNNTLFYSDGNVGIGTTMATQKLDVNGSVQATAFLGNATTASTLLTARNINGVAFNGSTNITVTANTPQLLSRGSYLTGNNFNGDSATTWNVDATSANEVSKVVARDVSGNFSANRVTTESLHVKGTISSEHIVPSSCNVYDLGTSNLRWRDLYLSGNTIDLNGLKVSQNSDNNLRVMGNILIGTKVDYTSNVGKPASDGRINGVNVTALYRKTKSAYGDAVRSVQTWTSRASAADSEWSSICWSPELSIFVAVALMGTNRVMTSPNGIVWTAQTQASNKLWKSVCWSPELSRFVAVSQDNESVTDRVMYSSDGINWISTNSASSISYLAVCWSPELSRFVAVGENAFGTTNGVMYSSDGIVWTATNSAASNSYYSVCWSPELGMFVALASEAVSNSVMYSYDGISWYASNDAAPNRWDSVCWSPELSLFVAVASFGETHRVMTSTNGINWSLQSVPEANGWSSVCWSQELSIFLAIAVTGTSNRVMASPDGINWTVYTSATNTLWVDVCWSPELSIFVAVAASGLGNRVMTSKPVRPASQSALIASSYMSVDHVTGNLGIGVTSTTNAKLHILHTGTGNAVRIDDETSDTTYFLVNQDGNVGIGTNAAVQKLDVNGSVKATAFLGNATTATSLQTGRTINGVLFDGTSNITISASIDSTSANQVGTVVARDASGNFSANVITASSFVGNGSLLTGISSSGGSYPQTSLIGDPIDWTFSNIDGSLGLLRSSNTELFRGYVKVDRNGLIGIHAGNPSAILHVAVNTETTNDMFHVQEYESTSRFIVKNTGYVGINQIAPLGPLHIGSDDTAFVINDSGYVGIGTEAPVYSLQLSQDSAAKPSTNTWTIASDERVKEDIEVANYDMCYSNIRDLELRRYKYTDGIPGLGEKNVSDRHVIGWIAQEVEPVFPKSVKTVPSMYGINDFKMLNADQIYASMYGALKKMMGKIEALEAHVYGSNV